MPFEVVQIPVWRDNYAYLLVAQDRTCALVDGPEAEPILQRLDSDALTLTHIFPTHHHYDHVGAHEDLLKTLGPLEVWGSQYDMQHGRIPGQTRALKDGEIVEWAGELASIREIPGHTLGHLLWSWSNGTAFVGDTLFAAGCGRLFEGTAEQLDRSLYEVIGSLPDSTLLYCGHEYTQANLAFARTVDGSNPDVLARVHLVDSLRERGLSTVPSTLAEERSTNPFLRCDTPAIREFLNMTESQPRHQVLGALRAAKDDFTP